MKQREIKFRVWDNKKWVNHCLVGWGNIPAFYVDDDFNIISLPEAKTQQFTGLYDINGKEIYEGDVLSGHYFGFNGDQTDNEFFAGLVMKSEWATFGIQTENGWLEFLETSHFDEPCLEVVGNIYENPELLENNP